MERSSPSPPAPADARRELRGVPAPRKLAERHSGGADPHGLTLRLRAALAQVLGDERLWWGLAVLFGIRLLFLAALARKRPDALNFVTAGGHLIFAPGSLYTAAETALRRTGTLPIPGHGFLYPPAAAFLAAPFGWLGGPGGIALWTVADGLAALAALWLFYRLISPQGVGRPVFWAIAAYFPPLFAEVDAGQIGGFVLLLGVLSMRFARTRPWLAGALGGVATAVKLYPAGLVLGTRERRYWASLAASAAAISVATFAPLGPGGALAYFQQVLFPATLKARFQDCAIDSVKTLYSRTVGGDPYFLPAAHGLTEVRTPIDLPWLATGLTLATLAGLVIACVLAGRVSGWNPVYGLALGFGLGALIPSEVNPYQFLPLLPLLLLVVVKALQQGRYLVLAVLAVALVGFLRQPCDLPFPNLWTLAGVAMYVVGVSQASLFRAPGGGLSNADQRPSPVPMGRPRHLAGDQRPR